MNLVRDWLDHSLTDGIATILLCSLSLPCVSEQTGDSLEELCYLLPSTVVRRGASR